VWTFPLPAAPTETVMLAPDDDRAVVEALGGVSCPRAVIATSDGYVRRIGCGPPAVATTVRRTRGRRAGVLGVSRPLDPGPAPARRSDTTNPDVAAMTLWSLRIGGSTVPVAVWPSMQLRVRLLFAPGGILVLGLSGASHAAIAVGAPGAAIFGVGVRATTTARCANGALSLPGGASCRCHGRWTGPRCEDCDLASLTARCTTPVFAVVPSMCSCARIADLAFLTRAGHCGAGDQDNHHELAPTLPGGNLTGPFVFARCDCGSTFTADARCGADPALCVPLDRCARGSSVPADTSAPSSCVCSVNCASTQPPADARCRAVAPSASASASASPAANATGAPSGEASASTAATPGQGRGLTLGSVAAIAGVAFVALVGLAALLGVIVRRRRLAARPGGARFEPLDMELDNLGLDPEM
jgi:hypothetical protein